MSRTADIAQETIAMGLLGDGIVAGLFPRHQLALWNFERGPQWYRKMVRATQRRPWAVRAVAATEAALALWWAYRLTHRYQPATDRRPHPIEALGRL